MLRADAMLSDNPTTMPIVQPIEGIPTRTDIAFTNKAGVEKSGIRKDAEKALQKLAPVLRRMLATDEFVVYVAGGCAPMNGLEQYSFGWFAQFVSRMTLVITNMRILAFRVDTKGKWTNSVRGLALGDLQSAKLTGFVLMRYMKLKYANGKKEAYWAMKLRDKTKLAAIMPKLLEANAGKQTPAQGAQPFCPTCSAALIERQYECNGCGQKFRSEDSLWWRAFIPGAGYFYAKQTGMGLLHAIVDSLITIEFLAVIVGALTVDTAKGAEPWFVVGWITFLLLLERAIALSHARRFVREFIPIEGTAHAAHAATASR
jgi:hypothetical protein